MHLSTGENHGIRTEMQLKIAFFKTFKLTHKQINVAVLVTEGFPNKIIAERLFCREKRIKDFTGLIYKKCNVKTRAELIVLTFRGIMGLRYEDTTKVFNTN